MLFSEFPEIYESTNSLDGIFKIDPGIKFPDIPLNDVINDPDLYEYFDSAIELAVSPFFTI